jgi:hypothetical protein
LPEGADAYRLVVDATADSEMAALEKRVYWCRYENAFGQGWETENAWQPDEELLIRALPRLGHAH